ncbi:MAG TPA: hypothetical protein VGY94_12430 [Acidobacteriaceae bacterium]|jgi:hypothetical protein|nr:hypothetical protein [Acidobacteriaceae bacterium]
MTRVLSRTARLAIVFDLAVVVLFALFLWAPWDRSADAAASSFSMLWLALPVTLSRHGIHLGSATVTVTFSALVAAALGALLSIAARMRGSAALWAAGTVLFGCSVAILMPLWTAVGFLGALLLIVALRARLIALQPVSVLIASLSELWPLGYAIGFAVLAWRYNPQLLIKTLLIAFGASLIARAVMPSRENRIATADARSLR